LAIAARVPAVVQKPASARGRWTSDACHPSRDVEADVPIDVIAYFGVVSAPSSPGAGLLDEVP